jgi:hypothetical protein
MAFAVSDDAELLLSAMAYIGTVHKAVTAQDTLPASGVGERAAPLCEDGG